MMTSEHTREEGEGRSVRVCFAASVVAVLLLPCLREAGVWGFPATLAFCLHSG